MPDTHIDFDIAIIGGGAAGIMAAISCKRLHPDYRIAIIDRTFALGRKILVCGAGRCNVTNINLDKDKEKRFYGANPAFIKSVFDQFGYKDIINFLNDLGIETYVERKTEVGKLFPITNQAKTVTALLEDELHRLQIKVFLNTECRTIEKGESGFILKCSKVSGNEKDIMELMNFQCTFLILAAGGKTYPALGANGSGYQLAAKLGHRIIEPIPSALPLEARNPLSQGLQGVRMDIEATSIINSKAVKTAADEVMFTQYGLSGPAILNISREISIHFNREQKNNCSVKLNFFPGKNAGEVLQMLEKRWQKRPDQQLEKSLFGIFPNKIPQVLLKIINLNPEKPVKILTDEEKNLLTEKLTNYPIKVTGTRGWNEAEFTAGGVDSAEVTPGTLESKKIKKLYFCGEILDVDGDVGGFNLSWAWSSGYVAGRLG